MQRLVGAFIAELNGRFPWFGELEAELGGGDFAGPCDRVFSRANL